MQKKAKGPSERLLEERVQTNEGTHRHVVRTSALEFDAITTNDVTFM